MPNIFPSNHPLVAHKVTLLRDQHTEPKNFRELIREIAALLATLVAHQETKRSAQVMRRNERDASNWKWVGRWERMQK